MVNFANNFGFMQNPVVLASDEFRKKQTLGKNAEMFITE